MAHQCLVCFDYEADCPLEGFRFTLARSGSGVASRTLPPNTPPDASPPSLSRSQPGTTAPDAAGAAASSRSRRNFLKHGIQLVASLAVSGLLTAIFRRRITTLQRPPGVVDEERFVENCLRCLQCVRSCPNQIIKITGGEHGFASLYTPHLEFRPYGCDYFCQVCQQVCPNRAIPLQSLEQKQSTPIGIARIDETVCVVYKEKFNCLVCEEVCPIPEKAIRYEQSGERTADGEPLREPRMVPEACIGCGICEAKCPAEPVAIRVFAG